MYFSRITLTKDPTRATQSIHALLRDDAYKHHQFLWRFFPNRPDDHRDFLFRFVENEKHFYLLSPYQPTAPDVGWNIEIKEYKPKITQGMRLSFELRANPVVPAKSDRSEDEKKAWLKNRSERNRKEKPPTKKRLKHDAIMHAKRQLMDQYGVRRWGDLPNEVRPPLYEFVSQIGKRWLENTGKRLGFDIEPESFQANSYLQHCLKRKEKLICYSTLDFSGILSVTDPKKFEEDALFKGIGPAKAFGCGLMLIRRT